MARSSTSEPPEEAALRIEEARLLKEGALRSAQMVMYLITGVTVLYAGLGRYQTAATWFFLTSAMVGVTILYARYVAPGGITRENHSAYLRGHIAVTATTGSLWCIFGMTTINFGSDLEVLVPYSALATITLGGMMSGAAFRPGYLALTSTTLLPFGVFLTVVAHNPAHRILGLMMLAQFLFSAWASRRTDQNTRSALAAQIRQNLADELIATSEQVERLNEERLRFVASLSHDIAQPTAALRYFIGQLQKDVGNPEQRAMLDKIAGIQANQERLLKDLMQYGRIESAAIVNEPVPFNLRSGLGSIVAETEIAAHARSVTFSAQLVSETVVTDPQLLGRVLRNILSNAVKYSRTNGVITLTSEIAGETLVLTVEDNGPGIPPDLIAMATEEYVRFNRSEAGLGLGLAIAKRLVEILGGTFELKSRLGEGTRATVTVPIAGDAGPVTRLEQTPFIMVVGDNPRPEFGGWPDLISSWRWKFLSAPNALEAAKLLSGFGIIPDIVVIDHLERGVLDTRSEAAVLRPLVGPKASFFAIRNPGQPASETIPDLTLVRHDFGLAELHTLLAAATAKAQLP
jgi:signal transduction histidine kinase